ncbi:MFS transporter [Actinoallomurus soli]|uniref:MFS transporter n=1 Tax=Actinoallomurus soli TaxID=2952535 RepID=UPI002092B7BE|nr:MFS transporter [Actinoallomurus soli]MCO5971220.1 MFS transporter [Actinoallomurus soli]
MRTTAPVGERVREGQTLAVVSAATMLALMNYNATFSTLAAMARDLNARTAGQTWILGAISLGTAVLLLAVGGLADDHGRKRVFVAGAGTLAASSVVCALAPTTASFVAGRLLQGGATAALLAAGLGLIGHAFPPGPERARATGVWGAMLGLGIALGPEASAGLAELAGWRAWYVAAAVASVGLAATAGSVLRESRAAEQRSVDLPGILTLGPGVAALLGAITLGRGGWARAGVFTLGAVAVILLAAFVVAESRSREPLLDLRLLRRPDFAVATGGAFVTGVAVIGLMSYLPTIVGRVLGAPPLLAGAVLTLWSGVAFAVSLQVRRLRAEGRHLIAAGLALCALGDLGLIGLSAGWGWWRLVPGLVVSGAGSGLLNAALARMAVESVPPSRTAMGSGANNTARYIGASIGVAVVVALATSGPNLAHGTDVALAVCAALAFAGAPVALAARGRRLPGPAGEAPRACASSEGAVQER